jgi:haloalkane dehalogenase
MKALRTTEERFANLPDFPFVAHYLEVGDSLRMHYLDEGPPDGPVVLLLHGEPSWCYLYRHMIPPLVAAGFRTIAPDLIGFGKSDKPSDQSDYSYQAHLDWTKSLIDQLELTDIRLFCQDWGGLIGLRLAAQTPDRFPKIVASNTFLPNGVVETPEVFLQWRAYSRSVPTLDVGKIIQSGTHQTLSEETMNAYRAPFPDESYKAGARIFPSLVPVTKDDPEAIKNRQAWEVLQKWEKPFLTLFGAHDAIMQGADRIFQQLVPGTKGQPHAVLEAGHFIQEEKGVELAKRLVEWW